jgi:signal transduction histidine kinase
LDHSTVVRQKELNENELMKPHEEHQTVKQLLLSREARGLTWSLSARLVFLLAVAIATLLGFIVIWPTLVLTVCAIGVVLTIHSIHLARREKHLRYIGFAGVVFDLGFLAMIPFLWHQMYGTPEVPPVYLVKLPLILPILAFMVINTMALQPLYPAIVAAGSLVLRIVTATTAFNDPRVETSENLLEYVTGPAVSVNQLVLQLMVIVLVGFFLTFMAKAARQLVRDVVDLETENRRILQEQSKLIMEVKMAGMANLVAGVAHEINTPLGATMSSADIVETCGSTLGEAIQSARDPETLKKDRKVDRGLSVLKDTSRVIKKSGDRIAGVVDSLKNFSRLDEAETQMADIRTGLDSTLSLITPETKGNTRIVKEYGDVPEILCRPRELNQVFMTILMNAFQAMEGEGLLRLRVAKDGGRVMVEIADSGKGIPSTQLDDLFDIGFETKKTRIGMGLGLPTAKSIIARHGGILSVVSEVGKGTAFRIDLPIRRAANDAVL